MPFLLMTAHHRHRTRTHTVGMSYCFQVCAYTWNLFSTYQIQLRTRKNRVRLSHLNDNTLFCNLVWGMG